VSKLGSLAQYTASRGLLAFLPVGGGLEFALVGPNGSGFEGVAESTEASYARFSPNGTRVAFDRVDEAGGSDIWLAEPARQVTTRLTFDAARDEFPIWSPDGARILFRSNRGGVFDLYERAADGSGEDRLVLGTKLEKWPSDWSHDGRHVIYEERGDHDHFWLLPMSGNRTPVPWTRGAHSESHAQFSPDDRWVAYQSNQSGRWEAYIRPFAASETAGAATGAPYQVSRDGGYRPVWRGDGRQLAYVAEDGQVMTTDLTIANNQITAGVPRPLFRMPLFIQGFARLEMSPDASRFLVKRSLQGESSGAVTVVMNWQTALGP
jgi:Tol biopolymer transport system component